jgi:hypothetical protein
MKCFGRVFSWVLAYSPYSGGVTLNTNAPSRKRYVSNTLLEAESFRPFLCYRRAGTLAGS